MPTQHLSKPWILASFPLLAALACNSSGGETPGGGGAGSAPDQPLDTGKPVEVGVVSQALTQINQRVSEVEDWTTEDLLSAYPVTFDDELGFSPTEALNYSLIADSVLGLSPQDEAKFEANGFVIPTDRAYATFSYAYHSIYAEDLPVFVSADSVLDALHRSYDDVLQALEQELLIPTLRSYLDGMKAALAAADVPDTVRQDTDFFLSVAQQLLLHDGPDAAEQGGEPPPAVVEGDAVSELVALALAADPAIEPLELFGVKRMVDLSQFKPRGHYTDSLELRRYFRAMIWLGRIDLRMLETLPSGEQVFRRRQAETAALLRGLMDEELLARWKVIDDVVTAFVGEHDYMTALDMDELLAALNVPVADPIAGLADYTDDEIAQAIIDGQYGEQRIASHAMVSASAGTLPLSASFALFGQRYTVDSHVFSQVVFDRAAARVVPDPLDAAFAALGNDQAATLLVDQLNADNYASDLGRARVLVEEHPSSYWDTSLYTLWLSGLKTLSAQGGPASQDAETAPSVTRTEAWGRRLLNTQLGSWAQLRHDTLLYVKQSYTGGSVCEYPDAYVDPYPAFWRSLQHLGEKGAELVNSLPAASTVTAAADYFTRFTEIVSRLADMAENQQTGMPHSEEQLAFINDAVVISGGGSGPPSIDGWYHQLLFYPYNFHEVDNVIADVHTDIGGDLPRSRPASVLHVGTASPRAMVVAFETCEGPRAYIGPVFNYKERLEQGFVRLTDEEWQELLWQSEPPGPEWLDPVVGE